jgi:hypothetical protein
VRRRVSCVQPGETILGHTNEFLGGRKTVTVSNAAAHIIVCGPHGSGAPMMDHRVFEADHRLFSAFVVRVNKQTMMKARSSMGRNFIEVCKCAGWSGSEDSDWSRGRASAIMPMSDIRRDDI